MPPMRDSDGNVVAPAPSESQSNDRVGDRPVAPSDGLVALPASSYRSRGRPCQRLIGSMRPGVRHGRRNELAAQSWVDRSGLQQSGPPAAAETRSDQPVDGPTPFRNGTTRRFRTVRRVGEPVDVEGGRAPSERDASSFRPGSYRSYPSTSARSLGEAVATFWLCVDLSRTQ
jgi:hypothetical protein